MFLALAANNRAWILCNMHGGWGWLTPTRGERRITIRRRAIISFIHSFIHCCNWDWCCSSSLTTRSSLIDALFTADCIYISSSQYGVAYDDVRSGRRQRRILHCKFCTYWSGRGRGKVTNQLSRNFILQTKTKRKEKERKVTDGSSHLISPWSSSCFTRAKFPSWEE